MRPNAETKPVVYLLPGLMCDEAVWSQQRHRLADQYDIRVPVFRGFDSLRAMAAAVLRDAPAHFSVVGHSMGGRVAFELLQLAGKRVEHFAVMDTGAHPVRPEEPAKRQLLLEAAQRKGLQAVADAWILPMLHPDNQANTALVRDITAMILRNTLADYQGQVKALLGRSDQRVYLPQISQRTWLLVGEADGWSPVSQHQEMAALIPRSELRVIPGCGHMGTMEQPQLVTELLREWLNAEA